MQSLSATIEALGGELTDVGDRPVPVRFARPRRGHQAVRNAVGTTVHPWGVIVVEGTDRRPFLDDTLTCELPPAEGAVRYGFLLDPDGAIEADGYVVHAGERYLWLTAPDTAAGLAATLAERTFIQDVTITDTTEDHAVLGVHGPATIEKLTSVLATGVPPDSPRYMTRGAIRDAGVSLVRLDAPAGEVGVAVVCRHEDAGGVFDALISLGAMATPVGLETWRSLTLEAGTPLYNSELAGRTPNGCGQLHAGVDLEKGCFVGQEVVARVANRGQVQSRLVGLVAPSLPAAGTTVTVEGDTRTGVLTRRGHSPARDAAIGMAEVPASVSPGDTAAVGDETATISRLPLTAVGEIPGRLPRYLDRDPSDG